MLSQINNARKILQKLIEDLDDYTPNATDVSRLEAYDNSIDGFLDLLDEIEHSLESLRERIEVAEEELDEDVECDQTYDEDEDE